VTLPTARPPATPGIGARLAAASREDAVRERFLRAVLAQVPLERVAEVHLFAPMRQGGIETGVAVVAARHEAAPEEVAAPAAPVVDVPPAAAAAPTVEPPTVEPPAVELPAVELPAIEPPAVPAPTRHTVYTARYRLTVKGPDRGRWQVDVRADADAPLLTIDEVVRGVQRRAGDASAATRLDAEGCARAAGVAPSIVAAPAVGGAPV
jgi:hypothetical protein